MIFIETRGNDGLHPKTVSFSTAMLNPLTSFGGLYSPEKLPDIGADFLSKHTNSDYKTLATALLTAFDIDVAPATITEAVNLYDKFDDPCQPVPVIKVNDDLFVSELYHGPTRAFKDMALQPFGVFLSAAAQERNEQYLILAATSGDTGPAALETFKNKPNVRVACLYPVGGTSDVQRLQMVTEDASNIKVIGIKGDFDDAQSALKFLLGSVTFKQKLKDKSTLLSAANSVNFGRIIFQIIYHLYSYLELVRQKEIELGDKVYLNVPSGNFGNALGAYYAQQLGLPVEKILIASNKNNVLTEFITTGVYDLRHSSVVPTTSPAMDILKSSNVERILFDLFGHQRTAQLMRQLDEERHYQLEPIELERIKALFAADYCEDQEGMQFIKECFDSGYLMDPHTATCLKAHKSCREKPYPTIVYSTAEWTKFSPVVAKALNGEDNLDDLSALEAIAKKANINIPSMIKGLFSKPIAQPTIIEKEDIEEEILKFI